jgi:hypothetical protein
MTQTQIIISAYPITECGPGFCSIALGIGKDYPSRRVSIRNVADCRVALELFAKEMEATQKPWRLLASFDKKSGRKPNGFDRAQAANELIRDVNSHLTSAEGVCPR